MKPSAKPSSLKGKGRAKENSNAMAVDDNDIDIEAAMDAELKEALQDAESDSEEPMDYNIIKNFLESYKSQAGLSGPVSNLAGRLQPGMKLPRDDVWANFILLHNTDPLCVPHHLSESDPMIHAVLICCVLRYLKSNPSRWSNLQSILRASLGWPSSIHHFTNPHS